MRITSLLENTTKREDMKVEHGLSLYIETEAYNILFDMGQTDLFYENALTLGIDLAKVDLAVLSHGHYDHGGGLRKFLEINLHAPVYLHRDVFLPHYNGTEKYIGLDISLKDDPRLIFTEDECYIDDSLEEVVSTISKWKAIKTSGSSAIPAGNATASFRKIDQLLKDNGVFIVPVGELECFIKEVGGHGPDWANDVLEKYPDLDNEVYKGITEFVSAMNL